MLFILAALLVVKPTTSIPILNPSYYEMLGSRCKKPRLFSKASLNSAARAKSREVFGW